MALNAAERQQVYRSALAMARALGPNADPNEIARSVKSRSESYRSESFFAFLNIARSAVNTANMGRELSSNPDYRPAAADLPIDPTIRGNMRRFQYRVVVNATNPDTLETFETAFNIRSSTSLTAQELAEQAIRAFQRNQLERDYRARIQQIGDQAAYEVFVVGAGRRG